FGEGFGAFKTRGAAWLERYYCLSDADRGSGRGRDRRNDRLCWCDQRMSSSRARLSPAICGDHALIGPQCRDGYSNFGDRLVSRVLARGVASLAASREKDD